MSKADLSDTHSSMGVFAYMSGTSSLYFSDSAFTPSEGSNTWVGGKYWPLNPQTSLDFIMYAPHTSHVDDSQNLSIYYNRSNNILTMKIPYRTVEKGGQIDWLYGEQVYSGTSATYGEQSLPVKMKHAMAKVSIEVKADIEELYQYESVQIMGTPQAGTFTIDYNKTPVTCTPSNGGGGYNHYFSEHLKGTYLTKEEINVGSILVFPIKYSSLKLNVKYKMSSTNDIVYTETIDLYAEPTQWECGKHYIYTIALSSNKISITPTVDDFNTGN